MHVSFQRVRTSGFSLVEAVVVSALILLVFGGLLLGAQYSLELIAQSRAKLSALSLANDRMEFFRSLPYDDVGTIAGIPPGVIPQLSTTTLNDITFTERVLVEYVDDPADGQLTATTTDNNGIPSDYKRIKIEISWDIYETPGQIALVSNIVPRSIETTVGGGTVRVNVIDQDSLPLENASVRLRNDTTTTTVDVTRFTDASGVALFSGAPAASNYEIIVTAPGYSTDQTYVATTTNPNPATAPFTVLEADISTLTFQIDELSNLTARVLTSATYGSEDAVFSDPSVVATSTEVTIVSDELVLNGGPGSYSALGEAFLETVIPSSLVRWEAVTLGATTPTDTALRVRFYTASGTDYTLIPNSDLPGNGTGFDTRIINLSALDPVTYPSIVPHLTLESSDSSVTPQVAEVRTFYRAAETTGSGITATVQGSKVIGTELDASPIYKTTVSDVTDAQGEILLNDLEFDTYAITFPAGFDVAAACPTLPVVHRGGEDTLVEVTLAGNTAHSVLVRVVDSTGNPIPGAAVELESSLVSYTSSRETTPCGAAFFSGLTTSDDYRLTISKPGYAPATVDPIAVDGDVTNLVILNTL